jgi:hypothetical protein
VNYSPDVAFVRSLLSRIAYGETRSRHDLLRFAEERNHPRLKSIRDRVHDPSSLLAAFGIHPCGGCGRDFEEYREKHGRDCPSCEGSGWHHEERALPGYAHEDPDYPGWGFTVRWKPGLFGKTDNGGWVPIWREV